MNRYDTRTKEAVRKLRMAGYTYSEIQQEVGQIPKPSLSYICKDIIPTKNHVLRLRQLNLDHLATIRLSAYARRQQLHEQVLKDVEEQAARIVASSSAIDRDKIALSMLYLGEGRKRHSYRGLSLGGSDPTTLKIYLSLLERCYDKKPGEMRAAVQYRADQDIEDLTAHWAAELNLRHDQFYRTKPDPRTKGMPTKRQDYKGVCVITCSGANIQLELEVLAKVYMKTIWGYSSVD